MKDKLSFLNDLVLQIQNKTIITIYNKTGQLYYRNTKNSILRKL